MHGNVPEWWGQISGFQNTFLRACDEIRLEIQSRKFRGLISVRLVFGTKDDQCDT